MEIPTLVGLPSGVALMIFAKVSASLAKVDSKKFKWIVVEVRLDGGRDHAFDSSPAHVHLLNS